MGFRFRRTIKIAPGIRLNLSKSGVSTSIGKRGATVNLSKRGTYGTIGLPGTGLSWRGKLGSSKSRSDRKLMEPLQASDEEIARVGELSRSKNVRLSQPPLPENEQAEPPAPVSDVRPGNQTLPFWRGFLHWRGRRGRQSYLLTSACAIVLQFVVFFAAVGTTHPSVSPTMASFGIFVLILGLAAAIATLQRARDAGIPALLAGPALVAIGLFFPPGLLGAFLLLAVLPSRPAWSD